MKKILVIDNADSFVYNLVELLRQEENVEVNVVDSHCVTLEQALSVNSILLSPGAGVPLEYPQMKTIFEAVKHTHPILGVCLGHQAIATYFGAQLKQMAQPRHGHTSYLQKVDSKDKILQGIHNGNAVGRYHSWVVAPDTLPAQVRATSYDEEGNIMSIAHQDLPIYGLQFHPESIISDCGVLIIKNFLAL
ncbi:MAG: aminodeoxychorismate/anthranilate synthase component II [Bacteroidales bacterium]